MTPDGVNVKHPDQLWINGRWVAAHSGRMIELISPDTERVIGAVAKADAQDMDAAVSAARAAFDAGPWSRMRPAERIALLKRMADHLRARTAEIARAWTLQMGGLVSFAGPYGIMLNKLAYALAAGCTIILKPSPETPLETYIIAEAAGIPAGVAPVEPGHQSTCRREHVRERRRSLPHSSTQPLSTNSSTPLMKLASLPAKRTIRTCRWNWQPSRAPAAPHPNAPSPCSPRHAEYRPRRRRGRPQQTCRGNARRRGCRPR